MPLVCYRELDLDRCALARIRAFWINHGFSAMKLFWLISGVISLALGLLGVALPLLPTVPFLLLSAFCFSQSSERLHDWLTNHPAFGPVIHNWRDTGAISQRAKAWASLSLVLVLVISVVMGLRFDLLALQVIVLVGVAIFIWTRPNE